MCTYLPWMTVDSRFLKQCIKHGMSNNFCAGPDVICWMFCAFFSLNLMQNVDLTVLNLVLNLNWISLLKIINKCSRSEKDFVINRWFNSIDVWTFSAQIAFLHPHISQFFVAGGPCLKAMVRVWLTNPSWWKTWSDMSETKSTIPTMRYPLK